MLHRYLLAPLAALLLLVASPRFAHAQTTGSVGIGTTAPDASAALDIVSSNKGVLLPRVADATGIASPAPGLLVYQTGAPAGFYYNSGTAAAPSWQQIGTTTQADNLGNHTATTNIGLNGNWLSNAVGNSNGLRINSGGGVGIGTSNADTGLHIRTDEKPSVSGTEGVFLSGGASGNPNIELRGTNGFAYLDFANDLTSDFTGRIMSSAIGMGLYINNNNSPRLLVTPSGGVRISTLAGGGIRVILTDNNGNLSAAPIPVPAPQVLGLSGTTLSLSGGGGSVTLPTGGSTIGDNLGNHTATQNIGLNNFWLSNTTGSNTGIRIDSTGRVGIGVAAPGAALDVSAGLLVRGAELIRNQGAYLQWNRSSGGETWLLNQRGTGTGGIRFGQSDAVSSGTNSVTEWGRFDTNGNLGVGTASPTARLDVGGGILARGNGLISNQGAHLQWNRSGFQGETWLLNQQGGGNGGIVFGQSDAVGSGSNNVTEWGRFDSGGNLRLGSDGGNVAGTGPALEFVGPGVNTDPVGFYRVNPALDQSELRAVVGDNPDANDKFVVGYTSVSGAGQIPGGTFTPKFSVSSTGQVGVAGLAGTGTRLVTADANGNLSTSTGVGDNLGNHTATQNLNLAGNKLVGDGGSTGLAISSTGNVGIGVSSGAATQKLDVRGNLRLGDDGGNDGTGQAIEWVGPGVSTDPVGIYRLNPAADQSELRVVVGDASDANDKFVVGRTSGSSEGSIPGGTFTPNFTVKSDGQVNLATLAGTGTRVVVAAADGTLSSVSPASLGDNLGNHTATTNLGLNGNWLSNAPGNANGIRVDNAGNVGLGVAAPSRQLDVAGGAAITGAVQIGTPGNANSTGSVDITSSTVAPGLTLDQQQLTGGYNSGARDVWQSFTAGVSGNLTQLDLYISSPTRANGAVGTLTVYDGEGVDGTLLTSQSIVMNVVNNGFQQYPLNTTVPVLAGRRYTYRLQTPTVSIGFIESGNDPYPGGVNAFSNGGGFTVYAGDLLFKTYVNVLASTALKVTGNTRLVNLASAGTRMVTASGDGTLGAAAIPVDTDAQQLSKSGSTISLTNGGSVTDSDNQALGLSSGVISLTNGGSVTLPDASATNELQTLSLSGSTLSISGVTGTGSSITVPGDDLGNHTATQALNLGTNSLVGNGGSTGLTIASTGAVTTAGALTTNGALTATGTTRLTNLTGTGSRMVTTAADGTLGSTTLPVDTDAQQLSISGGTISLTNSGSVTLPDASATNELQTISKSGSTVTLSNSGGSFTDADNQNLGLSGASLSISGGTGVTLPDASATNELQTLSISGSTISISGVTGTGSSITVPSSADNLGNHTATTNIGLNGNWLSNAPGNANGIRVDNAGNVGVGISGPTQRLDVEGGILARSSGPVSNQGAYLQWNRSGGDGETWLLNQRGGGGGGIRFGSATTANVTTEWARFDGSGNLGIGAPIPSQKLDVRGNVRLGDDNSPATYPATGQTLEFVGPNFNTDPVGFYRTNLAGDQSELRVVVGDAADANDKFVVGRSIASGEGTLAGGAFTANFTVRSDGNVGIGTSIPGYRLDVAGDINASGSVRSNGNVITSDARFKQQVRPLGGALASVLAMRGVRYTWNALGVQHGGTAGAPQVGVLAQEVEKIYPELVSTDKDGYKAVNYAQLTPVLIEAIKELKAENEALKQQATAAQAQTTATLESLAERLRALEAGGSQARK